jgi:hypothetical protein
LQPIAIDEKPPPRLAEFKNVAFKIAEWQNANFKTVDLKMPTSKQLTSIC